jgi:hypothetical protein
MNAVQTFSNIEDFYNDNPDRRRSPEADYGVHWRLEGWRGSWRVSYIQNTGEVYAVHLGPYQAGTLPTGDTLIGTGHGNGPVLLLGAFPVDEERSLRDVFYRSLEAHLEGWPRMCTTPHGLAWVMERMQAVDHSPSSGER